MAGVVDMSPACGFVTGQPGPAVQRDETQPNKLSMLINVRATGNRDARGMRRR
jgi:hypothetical protein